jgi:hypothetical protein
MKLSHLLSHCLLTAAITPHLPALALPTIGSLSATEHPHVEVVSKPPFKVSTFGLCEAPQNADAFPSNPVPVEAQTCFDVQQFTATSNTPITAGTCSGFSVAFGPMGGLKLNMDTVELLAEWGDEPLNPRNCANARVAAVGWGALCTSKACATAEWEKIGGPTQSKGVWNPTFKRCDLQVGFGVAKKIYKTLNLEIIATQLVNGQPVRKLTKGTIRLSRNNGQCVTLPAQPPLKREPK